MARCSAARAACAGALLGLVPMARAAGAQFAYSGSVQYAAGTYLLDQRTHGLYLFNALSLAAGGWSFQVSLPVIFQSEPVATGLAPVTDASTNDPDGHASHHPDAVPAASAVTGGTHDEMGSGDAFLRTDLEVLSLRGQRPALRLVAAGKAPIAGSENFGTGEWDFGGGASLAHHVGGSFVFAEAIYWFLGDPAGIDVRDAVAYGISLGRPLGRFGALASLTGTTRLVDGVEPPVQVGAILSYRLRPGRSLSAGVTFGITDSASDVGISLGWIVGL